MNTNGVGNGTPRCDDCGAYLQRWQGRWRCPWTTSSDNAPESGDWYCGRPYVRFGQHRADLARPFAYASRPDGRTAG